MTAGSRRRIVLVNQYFPPDTAATARIAADFVAECGRVGVRVTVVCGYPSYEPTTRPAWRPLRRTRNGSTTVLVVGSTGFGRSHPVGRVVDYVTFLLGAVVVIPFVSARAACVVMTNPCGSTTPLPLPTCTTGEAARSNAGRITCPCRRW